MHSINKIIFGLITVFYFSQCNHREKDVDELVEDEYITEIDGIYYLCDCESHCGEEKINASGKNYYNNRSVKNTWKLFAGKPDSLWTYFDSTGKKTMTISFKSGMVMNKNKY